MMILCNENNFENVYDFNTKSVINNEHYFKLSPIMMMQVLSGISCDHRIIKCAPVIHNRMPLIAMNRVYDEFKQNILNST